MWGDLLFYCRLGMTAFTLKKKTNTCICECLDEIFVTTLTHSSLSLISQTVTTLTSNDGDLEMALTLIILVS